MAAVLFTDRSVARIRPQAGQVDLWDANVTGLGLRVSPTGRVMSRAGWCFQIGKMCFRSRRRSSFHVRFLASACVR